MINTTILVSSIIGGSIVFIVNYLLNKRSKKLEINEKFKREAYGNFVNQARGFLNDPILKKEEMIDLQKEFIKKYYNEIIISASPEVIKAVDGFFDEVSITVMSDGRKLQALEELVIKMRNDLNLQDKSIDGKIKLYTVNEEGVDKHYQK